MPRYRVYMVIDTSEGEFVHFQPTNVSSFIILDKEGYHYNGRLVKPRSVTDAYGYGGVVVYISMLGTYDAYDLACPYCAARGRCCTCQIDGLYAICPHCGEQYDLGSGTAVPTQGLANEYMLRLPLKHPDSKIIVSQ